MQNDIVWFITGCSTGLGHALAQTVLEQGARVVLTARNPERLAELAARHSGRAHVLALDVTDEAAVKRAVAEAEAHFGKIDVLVNNAGYGYFAAIEEGEDEDIRQQFEANVFGLFSMTRQVLPGMRKRRSGHIVNVSSVGGLAAFALTGYYHASKFAVEGFSESLAIEGSPLGIKVTVVEPGRFRTDWAGRSGVFSKNVIDDYAETAGVRRKSTHESSGNQPGDPARAAPAIIKAVEAEEPPLHLILGSDGYQVVQSKLEALQQNIEKWKDVTLSTDFSKA